MYTKAVERGIIHRHMDTSPSIILRQKRQLAAVIKKHPAIWNCSHLGTAKTDEPSNRSAWLNVSLEMERVTGGVHFSEDVKGWWQSMVEEYKRNISSQEPVLKFREMDFLHDALLRELEAEYQRKKEEENEGEASPECSTPPPDPSKQKPESVRIRDYLEAIKKGEFMNGKEISAAGPYKMISCLAKVMKGFPTIWNHARLQIDLHKSKAVKTEWIKLALEMERITGNRFDVDTLRGWWITLARDYRTTIVQSRSFSHFSRMTYYFYAVLYEIKIEYLARIKNQPSPSEATSSPVPSATTTTMTTITTATSEAAASSSSSLPIRRVGSLNNLSFSARCESAAPCQTFPTPRPAYYLVTNLGSNNLIRPSTSGPSINSLNTSSISRANLPPSRSVGMLLGRNKSVPANSNAPRYPVSLASSTTTTRPVYFGPPNCGITRKKASSNTNTPATQAKSISTTISRTRFPIASPAATLSEDFGLNPRGVITPVPAPASPSCATPSAEAIVANFINSEDYANSVRALSSASTDDDDDVIYMSRSPSATAEPEQAPAQIPNQTQDERQDDGASPAVSQVPSEESALASDSASSSSSAVRSLPLPLPLPSPSLNHRKNTTEKETSAPEKPVEEEVEAARPEPLENRKRETRKRSIKDAEFVFHTAFGALMDVEKDPQAYHKIKRQLFKVFVNAVAK